MARRSVSVDTLGEVRRALRILRRVERSLLQAERAEMRRGKKAAERLAAAQGEASRVEQFERNRALLAGDGGGFPDAATFACQG